MLFSQCVHASKPAYAIIFDCDGVLINSEGAKFNAWKKALEEYNVSYTLDDYLPVVGHTSLHIKNSIEMTKNITVGSDFILKKNQIYQGLQKKGLPLYHEAISFVRFVEQYKPYNIAIALASSAPRKEIEHNITTLGLSGIFDVIVSGEDDLEAYYDKEGTNKPKPYIYQETAKRLGVSPSSCVVFEDTNAGVEAAASAGMHVIAIPNEFTQHHNFNKALCILFSFEMLQKALQSLKDSKLGNVFNFLSSKLKKAF